VREWEKLVKTIKGTVLQTIVLLSCLWTGVQSLAQAPVPPPAPEFQPLSNADLDQVLGPIALYPDPLIAQILPAATLPSEVVMADRYVIGGGDPNLVEQQPWDPSIQALARCPTLLKWMDDNLAWTTELGQAFLYQQQDVMDSIQRLRAQAQALGNLQSNPQENVLNDDGMLEILPTNPEVVYVPVYQPDMVYYQRSYGTPFISFGIGLSIGTWLDHDMDWRDHHVIEWDRAHPRPGDWWSRRPSERPRQEDRAAVVWQPHNHPEVAPANRGDRGWNQPQANPIISNRTAPRPQQRGTPAPPVRQSQPKPAQQPARVSPSRPASGALIGVQSSRQTQQFSNRGQQSRQAIAKPAQPARQAAAPRPAPAARPEAPSGPTKR
jgi:hypothetical protein